MNTLEDLQQAFYAAVLERTEPEFVSSTHAQARLTVYRHTILDNLRNALALIYPGVWALLGDECANSVAFAFCKHKEHLPKTGCLDDWGGQFPHFLAELNELKQLVYLHDYANYEYLKHQSYRAESVIAIKGEELQGLQEEQIEQVRFSLLPSVFCCTSNYPLDEVEAVINNQNADAINLSTNKAYAIIARPENRVTTFWVSAELYCFLCALQNKLNLAASVQLTLEDFPQFDIHYALQFLLQHRLIAAIHI